ncbi:cytochrome P450 4c3-like protein, partial [Dinothrombium tinctorium]
VLSNANLIEKSSDYSLLKPWLNTGLLLSGGRKWKSRRKLLTPAFHFRILNDFIPIMNKNSNVLVNYIEKSEDKIIDLSERIPLATLDAICETAMGVSLDAQMSAQSEYVKAILLISDLIFE